MQALIRTQLVSCGSPSVMWHVHQSLPYCFKLVWGAPCLSTCLPVPPSYICILRRYHSVDRIYMRRPLTTRWKHTGLWADVIIRIHKMLIPGNRVSIFPAHFSTHRPTDMCTSFSLLTLYKAFTDKVVSLSVSQLCSFIAATAVFSHSVVLTVVRRSHVKVTSMHALFLPR